MEETESFLKFYDRVLKYLAIRPRSKKEIVDYLARKSVPVTLATKIIGQLEKNGFINDENFARWWIEQRVTFRPKGKRALLEELGQKGIDREISERIIGQEIDEMTLARRAAEKKRRSLSSLPSQERRQKMINFLLRRGFAWETIKKVLGKENKP